MVSVPPTDPQIAVPVPQILLLVFFLFIFNNDTENTIIKLKVKWNTFRESNSAISMLSPFSVGVNS